MARNGKSAMMNKQIRLNNSVGNSALKVGGVIGGAIILTAIFWRWIGVQFGAEFQVPGLLFITHISAFLSGMIVRGEIELSPIKTILNTSMQAQKQGAHSGAMEGRMAQRDAYKERTIAEKERVKAETALKDAERARQEAEKLISEQSKRSGRKRPTRRNVSPDITV